MQTGLTLTADKTGRQVCVVVVKGTFVIAADGRTRLDEQQMPPTPSDVFWGDPEKSAIRYESDFALRKPRVDVILNGHAHTPEGRAATRVAVAFEIGPVRKTIMVFGDRRWQKGTLGLRIGDPTPFVTMPLVWDRAFGGIDRSNPDPAKQGAELRNLVGTGYTRSGRSAAEGLRLPNLEDPRSLIASLSDRPPPIGCGSVGRGWQPRISRAGTYDKRWRTGRCPLLPEDFNDLFFQSAPDDQQLSAVEGMSVRCLNLTRAGGLSFRVPRGEVTISFLMKTGPQRLVGVLDTVIIEPDERRLLLTWRASVPLGRKRSHLRAIEIDARIEP